MRALLPVDIERLAEELAAVLETDRYARMRAAAAEVAARQSCHRAAPARSAA